MVILLAADEREDASVEEADADGRALRVAEDIEPAKSAEKEGVTYGV